jgi:hypothetical protein
MTASGDHSRGGRGGHMTVAKVYSSDIDCRTCRQDQGGQKNIEGSQRSAVSFFHINDVHYIKAVHLYTKVK